MRLNLYRRQRLDCEAGRPEDSRATEAEERRRGWGRKCSCQIHVSGTLGGKFSHKSTNTPDWLEAHKVADAYLTAGSWSGEAKVPQLAPTPTTEKPRVTVSDACEAFITNREAAGLAAATLRKYETFKKQITTYAESRGYVMLDQFTIDDIDRFWVNWKLGPRAKGKRLTMLRAFFRFCAHRKWIAESPVSRDIKPPEGANRAANKWPFSDAELNRIIKACDDLKVEWKNENGLGLWTGEDLKDLIWLMVYTGFRISDATLFDIERLNGDQVFIRATKNGGDVFAYVPDWLRDRLLARAKRYGERPFITGRSERLETVTNALASHMRLSVRAFVSRSPAQLFDFCTECHGQTLRASDTRTGPDTQGQDLTL